MSAAVQHLLIEQGSTFRHSLIVNNPAPYGTPLEDMTPVNLTGYTARMQIRKHIDDPRVILELTTENGRIAITPLTGRVDLLVSATDTATLTFSNAVYDLEIVSAGSEVSRILKGKIVLSPEVTR